ncbi:hypothetical protein [Streptomyces sp. NPDC059489]|uniref:hypothetical protein n=1 Tax=Streptomyces sp. NPDC059489 TaxID=3346849 RepID=UPI00369AAD7A
MNTSGLMVAGLITATAAMICAAVIHRSSLWAIAYVDVSVVCALGVVYSVHMRDELRAARANLERASRPAPLLPITDQVVAKAIAGACCEAWWASAGAEHDPKHCAG